ncbi:hypothetical protein [Methylobacterium aquaticum]|uniref:Uncharacterized protein n=1 Tax=Methylobacterium aquaticum TaxID=270351 RepID=A0A0J6SKX2_9HYPH|nr:hypothetical protein [Methylobacterium aquaticum]KMO34319.1 hypothetical protein VP06_14735 [Methylobacterium aquaticum]
MAKDMKVEDYAALADERTGLVPMKNIKHTSTESIGDVAGYHPHVAKRLHDEGWAEPVGNLKSVKPDEKVVTTNTEAERLSKIAIPDDWRTMHHLPLMKIASQLAGRNVDTKAEAEQIVETEWSRRKPATSAVSMSSLPTS